MTVEQRRTGIEGTTILLCSNTTSVNGGATPYRRPGTPAQRRRIISTRSRRCSSAYRRRTWLKSPLVRTFGGCDGPLEVWNFRYRQRGDDPGAFSVGGGIAPRHLGAAAPDAAAISLKCLDLVEHRLSTAVENGPTIGTWQI